MTFTKRGTAITGDSFTVEHPTLDLASPFTSFVDVVVNRTTHQVMSTRDRSGFDYANTTGDFAIGDMAGYVVETIDNVANQATHRYQAVVDSPTGSLSVHSYESAAATIEILSTLRPEPGPLGMRIAPDDRGEISGVVRVALAISVGTLELSPLTSEVDSQLPPWAGTAVSGGDLYGGRLHDGSPWLTLVTPTARAVVVPGPGVSADHVATVVSDLKVDWRP